jgi:hypothetical protein
MPPLESFGQALWRTKQYQSAMFNIGISILTQKWSNSKWYLP